GRPPRLPHTVISRTGSGRPWRAHRRSNVGDCHPRLIGKLGLLSWLQGSAPTVGRARSGFNPRHSMRHQGAMNLKAIALVLLGLLALGGSIVYSYLKPAPAASAPIEAVAAAQATVATGTARVYQIVSDQSQARFVVDEVRRGAPKTVVGSTDQVGGQIPLDPSTPQA